MKLSASRMNVIFRCQREFIFKYVLNIPEPWSKNLAFGKAWHEVLELKEPNLAELTAYDIDYPWADALHVMSQGYADSFPEHMDEVQREIKIEDDLILGYVDSVIGDAEGRWYIGENKTRAIAMDDTEAMMLPQNLQLQVYTRAVPQIAEALWLDPDLFQGVKYVTTIKPAERRKKTETKEEYGARLSSTTQVIEIPKAMLTGNPEPMMVQAFARAEDAENAFKSGDPLDVPGNINGCIRYHDRCPYFSRCHSGRCHEHEGRRILVAK